jgi:DNA-binding transcriptional ArsR family regulator
VSPERVPPAEVFRALADPVRWRMVQLLARQPELPGSTLDELLPVSKPTISYHSRLLAQAGLVETRKAGRQVFYSLRRDTWRALVDLLAGQLPELAGHDPGARDGRQAPEAAGGSPLVTW